MKLSEAQINAAPFEIERKFLITYPDLEKVRAMPGYRLRHIEQSYLSPQSGGGRIRRIVENGEESFVFTFKKKISDVRRREFERTISREEFDTMMKERLDSSITVVKDRHVFNYAGLTYELDVYAFWSDRATLEAEVESEETEIPLPPCVTLIREVTFDRRYNNSQLALNKGKFPVA